MLKKAISKLALLSFFFTMFAPVLNAGPLDGTLDISSNLNEATYQIYLSNDTNTPIDSGTGMGPNSHT